MMSFNRTWSGIGGLLLAVATITWMSWATAGHGMAPTPQEHQADSGDAGATSQPVDPDGPRVNVSPLEFDFGEVWENTPTKGNFTVKNTGRKPMTVEISTSCGCLVATKPKTPLEPGEADTFTIEYRTSQLGRAHKRVTVSTNDPTRPKVVLLIKGRVKPVFELDPDRKVMFRGLELESAETRTMKLRNNYKRPVELKLKADQDFGCFKGMEDGAAVRDE